LQVTNHGKIQSSQAIRQATNLKEQTMSKKEKGNSQVTEPVSPESIGAHFASVQADNGKTLIQVLKQCVQAYTIENKAEYTAMVDGYGAQCKTLYDANTAKTRKSEFKKVIDHASEQESRQVLFNVIDQYDSVQKLVKDLRMLESGKAVVNDEGKVEKVKAEKAEGEEAEGNSEVTASTQVDIGSKEGLIEALETLMQAAYEQGYANASELIQQAMASIGRGEK
jgi:hypothetical protein